MKFVAKCVFVTVVMLSAATNQATACSTCATVMLDKVLPPVGLWAGLAATWFIANGIIRSITGVRLPAQPEIVVSLVVAVAAFILGAAMIGMVSVVLLFIPAAWAFRAALRQTLTPDSNKGLRFVRMVGWLHVVAVGFATVSMIYIHATRTPAQFVVQWGGGYGYWQKFRKAEPQSLDSYRYIVEHGKGPLVTLAAQRIAEIGEPQDIPLLKKAMAKSDGGTNLFMHAITNLESRQR